MFTRSPFVRTISLFAMRRGNRLFCQTMEYVSAEVTPNEKLELQVENDEFPANGLTKQFVYRKLPVFATPRGSGQKVFSLVPWKHGEMISDYVLFEESIKKCRVPWLIYKYMTAEERTIYLAHYKAVQNRRLSYKCPVKNAEYRTVSQLLYDGRCCGTGCRHCPYELENCEPQLRKSFVWNGSYFL